MKTRRPAVPEMYCWRCGGRLKVTGTVPRPGDPKGPRRGRYQTRCPRCGGTSGGGWATMAAALEPAPRDVLARLLAPFRSRSQWHHVPEHLSHPPELPRYYRPDMVLDLATLLADTPFAVYGLASQPLGLRLTRANYGGGDSRPIEGISLNYVVGPPRDPLRTLRLVRVFESRHGIMPTAETAEYRAMRDLIMNYAPGFRSEPLLDMMELNRDWNWQSVVAAPREVLMLDLRGSTARGKIVAWDSPLRVNAARLHLGDGLLVAASLNLSKDELAQALTSLVVLQEAPEVLAQHQRDLEEVHREVRELHDQEHGSH